MPSLILATGRILGHHLNTIIPCERWIQDCWPTYVNPNHNKNHEHRILNNPRVTSKNSPLNAFDNFFIRFPRTCVNFENLIATSGLAQSWDFIIIAYYHNRFHQRHSRRSASTLHAARWRSKETCLLFFHHFYALILGNRTWNILSAITKHPFDNKEPNVQVHTLVQPWGFQVQAVYVTRLVCCIANNVLHLNAQKNIVMGK